MNAKIQTAVIAVAADQVRRQVLHALSPAQIELLGAAQDACTAIQLIRNQRPDLLIADMELPGMEGAALAEKVLSGFMLPVRPKVMLLRYPEFPVAGEDALKQLGVAFAAKPLKGSDFRIGIEQLEESLPAFSASAHRHADSLLDALGVPDHIGRNCLHAAALICATDERCMHNWNGRLYPIIGKLCGLDAVQVERAMRHVIGLAWQSDKFDNQYRIFADTVDAGRGQPTCGEMISRLADILRLEG